MIIDHTKETNREFLIVTGYSGAGMSSVLKSLEDLGYEVFDNFPLSMIEPLLADNKGTTRPIALGIDTRTRGFSQDNILEAAKRRNAKLIFITCDDITLQKRFTETRRRHPLSREKSVRSGIMAEHKLLDALRPNADIVIDTSDLSIHDLRHILEGHFANKTDPTLNVTLMSFGFKYGLPREADIVMDVRFLKNPYWEEDLKHETGLNPKVGEYIESDPDFNNFIQNTKNLLSPLLPRYAKEGKTYLTIAIGCTGGKHRSVHTSQTLGHFLTAQWLNLYIEHRDINI